MATHKTQANTSEVYFITFTCHRWLTLFEEAHLYSYFNKWFEYLRNKHAFLTGYVIMPNHFHGLVYLSPECSTTINKLVGNGKRFLAYEAVSRLKESNSLALLRILEEGVSQKERAKGKLHEVFRSSFDAKPCLDRKMVEDKLTYIHRNPVNGKWNLVEDWADYPYSSAGFYEKGTAHQYLTHYRDFI